MTCVRVWGEVSASRAKLRARWSSRTAVASKKEKGVYDVRGDAVSSATARNWREPSSMADSTWSAHARTCRDRKRDRWYSRTCWAEHWHEQGCAVPLPMCPSVWLWGERAATACLQWSQGWRRSSTRTGSSSRHVSPRPADSAVLPDAHNYGKVWETKSCWWVHVNCEFFFKTSCSDAMKAQKKSSVMWFMLVTKRAPAP